MLLAALVALAPLAVPPPAIDMTSLLGIRFYEASGGFMIEALTLVFPPDGDFEAAAVFRTKAGAEVVRMPLAVQQWSLPPFVGLVPGPGHPGMATIGREGDFVLDIEVAGRVAGSLPFSLHKQSGSDPYRPATRWMIEGPWRSLALLRADPAAPTHPVVAAFWTGLDETGLSGNQKVTVAVTRGGTTVAVSRPQVVSTAAWAPFAIELLKPGFSANFTLGDLTATAGPCRIDILVGDRRVKSFAATVRGGALVPNGRSALGFEPGSEHLVPKVVDRSSRSNSSYRVLDAWWLETR
ncbi:MAG: hypothetical protein AB7S39_11025 [Gemmatimonadales bacterium]